LTRRRRSSTLRAVVSTATIADVLVAAAWIALAADTIRITRRDGQTRMPRPPRAARLAVLALLVGGVALLELRGAGRLGFHLAAASAGVALAWAGVALHARARRALGARWSSAVGVPPGHEVVTQGPYAVVRHPIYLAILLLAAGTVLAHPSAATVCVATGLAAGMALKIPAEERALRAACGDAWTRYAADVPALVPRLSRASR
jgi:protein-S-isoprenylcysteine O-methyltransferase Ste14